jgi:excisionase family DNA binding protein
VFSLSETGKVTMAVLDRVTEVVDIGNYVTVQEAAKLKGVKYRTMHMWLCNHPEVPVKRYGRYILVRKDELEAYIPRY